MHILVLNHNGRRLLEECLPSVIACAQAATTPCRVTVVDNASTDGSTEFVQQRWPQVAVLHCRNQGLVSFNRAVRLVPERVVFLLNNDVRLAPGCVDLLADAVEQHSDCFLAGPHCWTFDGRYEGTRSALCFRRGLVHTRLIAEADAGVSRCRSAVGGVVGVTACTASAGAALAVNREKFLLLGGFDPLFLPGRYEDLDFAYRGWLAGWTAYYVRDAVAYHKGCATFGPWLGRRIDELDYRNALLFAWKNLREPRHLAVHGAYLIARIVFAALTGQTAFLQGLVGAMRRLGQLARSRSNNPPRLRTERELFDVLRMAAA
jgi:GT2 family glycosyltransferase